MNRILHSMQIGPAKRGEDASLRRTFEYQGITGILVKSSRSWRIESPKNIPDKQLNELNDLIPLVLRRKTQQEFRRGETTAGESLAVPIHIKVTTETALALNALRRGYETDSQCARRVLLLGLRAAQDEHNA